jgi:hypothetical protein
MEDLLDDRLSEHEAPPARRPPLRSILTTNNDCN